MVSERERYYDRMVERASWDERANPYETARRLHIVFDALLADADLAGRTLLDAGSGGGHFSERASRHGARVTAVDVGRQVLGQVQKRCPAVVIEGSILELPFADDSFDVVLSTEVIEHTPAPTDAIRELCRVLRPGGRLIVTSPNRLWQPVVRLATAVRLRRFGGYENLLWPGRARAVVEASGVRVERFVGFNLLPLFFEVFEPLHRRADRLGNVSRQPFVNWAIVGTKPQVAHPLRQTRG